MREIVLDTETTGFDPKSGHRVVEIGCVELEGLIPTGRTYQVYLNPERDMPPEAEAVHGLSSEFLADQPRFGEIVESFLEFIGEEAPLVIHNADFDLRFLNAEFERLERPPLPLERAIDTVAIARRKFPGAQASLDALCRRFNIDASARDKHGALLDAELLAQVYLELVGGRQPGLGLTMAREQAKSGLAREARPPRPHAPSAEESAAHERFLETLTEPIWRR